MKQTKDVHIHMHANAKTTNLSTMESDGFQLSAEGRIGFGPVSKIPHLINVYITAGNEIHSH